MADQPPPYPVDASAPPQGYPPQQGYPPPQGGYPPPQEGYPPPQQAGYPAPQAGYPPAAAGPVPDKQVINISSAQQLRYKLCVCV